VIDVACGFAHTVAVTSKGETWAWGDNTEYQCGMGFGHPQLNERITMPARVPGMIGRRAIAVSCGTAHSVVITADGEVFSWGAGSDGQLGLGTGCVRWFFNLPLGFHVFM
jgi:alpha-tubulin suppressor-like RCC1 family protein